MARKWRLFLDRIQSFLKFHSLNLDRLAITRGRRNRFVRPVFLMLLFLGVSVLPVTAQAPSTNPVAQVVESSDALVREGRELYDKGEYGKAIGTLKNAYRKAGDTLNQAMILSNLSLAYQQVGEWKEAQDAIESSLKLLDPNSSSKPNRIKLYASALEVQGKLQLAIGKPDDALETWQKAATKFVNLGDRTGEIRSQIHQSLALRELGFYQQALKILIQPIKSQQGTPISVIDWIPQQQDIQLKTMTLRLLGSLLRVVEISPLDTSSALKPSISTLPNSLENKEVSYLTQFCQIPPSSALPNSLDHKEASYLTQSCQILLTSLAISDCKEASNQNATCLKQPSESALTLLELGNTAKAAYYQSKDEFNRVLIYESLEDAQNHFAAAIDFYDSAMNRSNKKMIGIQVYLNQLNLLININQWLKSLLHEVKDLPEVILYKPQINQIEQRSETVKQRLQTQISKMPSLLEQLNSITINQSVIYAKIDLAQSLIKLMELSLALNKASYSSLIERLLTESISQAQALSNQRSEAYAKGTFGNFYEKAENFVMARKLTQEALVLTEQTQSTDIAYQWESQLGRILQSDKNPKRNVLGAIAAYETAVDTLSRLRQDLGGLNNPDLPFLFRDDVEPIYKELINLLLQSTESSMTSAAKSITLSRQNFGGKTLIDNVTKARQYIQALQVLELENFLRCRLQNIAGTEIDKTTETDLNAAIIYPVLLNDRLEILLKLPQQKLLKLSSTYITKEKVEREIQLFQKAINEKDSDKTKGVPLYNLLIRPVLQQLPRNITTLVFVLDGNLRNVSLPALFDEQEHKYLVEKPYGIALNLGLPLVGSQPLQKGRFKVLLGGVTVYSAGKEPVEGINAHLNAIASEVPGSTQLLNFTPETLKAEINSQPFSVVYLATHGEFSSNPRNTYLVAAADKRIDLNQMREVLRGRVETRSEAIELLVLAACQTAKGDTRATLGIAGVSVQSGARSTLASLVSANSSQMFKLMEFFYQELGKQDSDKNIVTKAEALRRAQNNLRQEGLSPILWAPFVLVGNWQ